jgi:protein gp37
MGDKSSIEWTDATWNPVRGCSIVSKGCTNCYAMRQAHRSSGPGGAYEGLTKLTKGGPVWTGAIRTVPELLDAPLKWKRPRRIFVNSMSDLFHEDVPENFITDVWRTMADAPQHIFQILTKRPERMRDWLLAGLSIGDFIAKPLDNVWLGVSVEDQASADERIPVLSQTPAAVRWISAEPLLGPIYMPLYLGRPTYEPRLHWLVVGGESGPGARPMHPDWVRSLRDQCAAAGVAFFFKQWGAWSPYTYVNASTGTKLVRIGHSKHEQRREIALGGPADGTEPFNMRRATKKSNGRELDGRKHDEYPA